MRTPENIPQIEPGEIIMQDGEAKLVKSWNTKSQKPGLVDPTNANIDEYLELWQYQMERTAQKDPDLVPPLDVKNMDKYKRGDMMSSMGKIMLVEGHSVPDRSLVATEANSKSIENFIINQRVRMTHASWDLGFHDHGSGPYVAAEHRRPKRRT